MSIHSYEHPTIRPFLNAVANWVTRYRDAIKTRRELARCEADEVARMAHDIGLSPDELVSLVKKGPHAADELPRLLRALGVDPQELASCDPGTMRSLEYICTTCGHKDQCRHDLAIGATPRGYHDYCPNATSIDLLLRK